MEHPDPAPRHSLGQFSRNLAAGVGSLVVNVLAGFILTPFLVSRMGLAAYGLVPLVLNLVNFLSVVNIVLNAALGRYVAVAAAQGDRERAVTVFSTALWGSVAAGAALLAVGMLAAPFAPQLIRVPAGNEGDAGYLLMAAVASTVATLCASPFSVAMFYVNRLDVGSRIVLVNRAVYVVLAFVLVGLVSHRPGILGVALLAAAGTSFGQTVFAWRRLLPWLRVAPRWDRSVFTELLWFGWWALVSHGGTLLLLTVDLVLVNRFLGPNASGVYAALILWGGFLRAYAVTIASVVTQPMAQIFGAGGEIPLMLHAQRSVRIMGILLAGPVAVVSGLSYPLLHLWLGPTVARFSPLLVLMTVPLSVSLATAPLVSAMQTVLKIRTLGILTLCCGLMNLIGAISLLRLTSWGMYGVALSGMLSLGVLNLGVVPVLAAKRFGGSPMALLRPLPVVVVSTGAGYALAAALEIAHACQSWSALLGHAAIVGVTVTVTLSMWLLSSEERSHLTGLAARLVASTSGRSAP